MQAASLKASYVETVQPAVGHMAASRMTASDMASGHLQSDLAHLIAPNLPKGFMSPCTLFHHKVVQIRIIL